MVVKFAGRAATPAYRQRIATVKRELTQFGALINPQFQPQTIKRKCLGKVQPMRQVTGMDAVILDELAQAKAERTALALYLLEIVARLRNQPLETIQQEWGECVARGLEGSRSEIEINLKLQDMLANEWNTAVAEIKTP